MTAIGGFHGRDLTGQVTILDDAPTMFNNSGPVGDMFLGVWDEENHPPIHVAVKIVRKRSWAVHKPRIAYAAVAMELIRESDKWLQLSHKNILPYFGHCFNLRGDDIALISLYCRRRTVMDSIKFNYVKERSADNQQRLELVTDVVNGLEYLQSMDIVHGHLVPNNVLIDNDGHARLTDFGQAKIFTGSRTSRGSGLYMAPEIMPLSDEDDEDKVLTHQSDIYAFAMVAFEIFTGKAPYSDPTTGYLAPEARKKVMRHVFEGSMRPQRSSDKQGYISDTMWAIMENCWQQEPAQRPLAAEVVSRMMNEQSNAELSQKPMSEKPPEPLFFLIDLVVDDSINTIPTGNPQPRSLSVDLHPHGNQFNV